MIDSKTIINILCVLVSEAKDDLQSQHDQQHRKPYECKVRHISLEKLIVHPNWDERSVTAFVSDRALSSSKERGSVYLDMWEVGAVSQWALRDMTCCQPFTKKELHKLFPMQRQYRTRAP